MSRFHEDLVTRAVKAYAFPTFHGFDEATYLPFLEPVFRLPEPGKLLVVNEDNENEDDVVLVSRKPEGSREIFVGIYDNADDNFYMYSMGRNKQVVFVHPENPTIPMKISDNLKHLRHKSNAISPHILFVFDVCRTYCSMSKRIFNVILSDLGPLKLGSSLSDAEYLSMNYNLHKKTMRVYRSPMDIHAILAEPCSYPYHADNGIVFVQVRNGDMPTLKSPCAKFTPSDLATVFFHVQPITTIKTRIWRMSCWKDNHLELYRTISAPSNFYVPPTGAIVAFRIRIDTSRWLFEPIRIRVDKVTPSSKLTLNRFIRRYVPKDMLLATTRKYHPSKMHTRRNTDDDADDDAAADDVDHDEPTGAQGTDGVNESDLNAFA